jgi:hypothetical protein
MTVPHNPTQRRLPMHAPSFQASELAERAVSRISSRQSATPGGARQYLLEHLLRAVRSAGEFDAAGMLDELRGNRISIDCIIDIYVPATARRLGEMWMEDEINFATVTVGAMRLQSLLSLASVESLDFVRATDGAPLMCIVVPENEDHSLGAFVLAAQLRRLGGRVDLSFCEPWPDLSRRYLSLQPDAVLFTASSGRTLETVTRIARHMHNISDHLPLMAVGGNFDETTDLAKGTWNTDLINCGPRDILTLTTEHKRSTCG